MEFKKKYFCDSQAHRKQDPPRLFLYLKKLNIDGGYYAQHVVHLETLPLHCKTGSPK
jgi:hypothetical protein